MNFLKVCPECKSSNIKCRQLQGYTQWICISCGNINFFPIEVDKKSMNDLEDLK
jgi:RNase P subunit RPR2